MFVTKRRFERAERQHESDYKDLREKYWELRRAHSRLLAHLRLEEVTTPQQVVLMPVPKLSGKRP